MDLVEEHAGNQLCVFCQGQLVWQFRNLTAYLENLFQAWRTNTYIDITISHVTESGMQRWTVLKPNKPADAAVWLTIVNSEEGPGVVSLLPVFTRYVLAQEVQRLVSAMAGHLLTTNHLQQREKNGFQDLRRICRGTDGKRLYVSVSSAVKNNSIATVISLLCSV